MNVELRIERLVLTGVPLAPGGRAALAAALSHELTALIQAGGLPPDLLGGSGAPVLVAPPAPAAPPGPAAPAGGARFGRDVARSVYSCLSGRRP